MLAEADRVAFCSRSCQPSPGSVVCKRRLWWGIAPPPACVKCGSGAVMVGVGRVEVRHCRDPSRGGRRRRGDSSHRGRQLNITFEPDPHKKGTRSAPVREVRDEAPAPSKTSRWDSRKYTRDTAETYHRRIYPGPNADTQRAGPYPHITMLICYTLYDGCGLTGDGEKTRAKCSARAAAPAGWVVDSLFCVWYFPGTYVHNVALRSVLGGYTTV